MSVPDGIGDPIPPNEIHPVSFRLPTWRVVEGLMEDEPWVTSKLRTGYPRFSIHPKVQLLAADIISRFGDPGDKCLLFPFYDAAVRCKEFIERHSELPNVKVRVSGFTTTDKSDKKKQNDPSAPLATLTIFATFMPESEFAVGKLYLRVSGEAIGSRLGAYLCQCPRLEPTGSHTSSRELYATDSKSVLKKRIASLINDTASLSKVPTPKAVEEDVFLFPSGLTAIFNAHRAVLQAIGEYKSVCYGFAFTDTIKLLAKVGPGSHFYGNGEAEDLDSLTKLLESGERITALFCEVPTNPLLKTPDLLAIRKLADKYNFAVVVDDTLANYVNLNLFPYADIVCCSLTKIFNGACDALGGSLVLNPDSKYYNQLKQASTKFVDFLWYQDADVLEKNSRDVVERAYKSNTNSQAVVDLLNKSPVIDTVYYPSNSPTRKHYEELMVEKGGYGSLFSILFKDPINAQRFYDALDIDKGPSLGTNFTLCCPFPMLAHYSELDYVSTFGVDRNLIRVSIGLEPTADLVAKFDRALAACN
ncbi:cystathionine gamma-synthase [Sugiyamaella lignohabitans]|uniref:Cystathionine gamma-synthase n=1 Tax=Sugiyamaella lignohabitans TaxID=796027 RepID=A0A167CMW2_9ASCO|nr:cystathionine gamma-synthase [Sugiyamaella lignohabitans]ANB11900.1 cystathionine gamma-synthase [Sugiyamaella lignohabitans]